MLRHVATVLVMDTALMKPAEVAHELRVSRATVYRLIAAEEIKVVHVGKRGVTRIERAAFDAYLAGIRKASAA